MNLEDIKVGDKVTVRTRYSNIVQAVLSVSPKQFKTLHYSFRKVDGKAIGMCKYDICEIIDIKKGGGNDNT